VDPIEIRLGAIVEAIVADPQGKNDKQRPLIVVGFENDNEKVVICAISSRFPVPIPRDCIPLPHDSQGHPSTGLTVGSVAVCKWVDILDASQLVCKRGYISTKLLKKIIHMIEVLADED
tara:strand:- start:202 stop:558 length:357 start_codon:yes stop_codon:yes gene_type:complete